MSKDYVKFNNNGGIILTAEIGILNKTGVALAADSAVTIGNSDTQKVYNSANKLFSLSKHHPIGIMIYGAAHFMGVPWETIIKEYRRDLGEQKFDQLSEYGDSFFEFVTNNPRIVSHYAEKIQVINVFKSYLSELINHVDLEVKNLMDEGKEDVTEEVVIDLLKNYVDELINKLSKAKFLKGFTDDFLETFRLEHKDELINVLEMNILVDLNEELESKFLDLASLMFSKGVFSDKSSGIVIAGYGEEEIFPALYEYELEGKFCGVLKMKNREYTIIDTEEFEARTTASIRTFAQKEMVSAFMKGIDPKMHQGIVSGLNKSLTNDYVDYVEKVLEVSLTKEQRDKLIGLGSDFVDAFNNEINRLQRENYVDPIIDIVDVLPKEELADMAEALVNLTSFKRRVTIDAETVGGPVDVAVITKGDGFIWIKRKHYFKPELNYHFFQNYMRGECNDGGI